MDQPFVLASSSLVVPEQIESSGSRKRKRLDYVKCDQCRKDKQKCLPKDRQWPTKCDRCIDKDCPCSEGTHVARKKTNKAVTPSPSLPLPEDGARPNVSSFGVSNWSFLLSYHRMIQMALQRLDSLKQDVIDLFTGNKRFEEYYELVEGNLWDQEKLQHLAAELQRILIPMSEQLLHSYEHRKSPAIVSSLIAHAFLVKPDPSYFGYANEYACSSCNETYFDRKVLQNFRLHQDSIAEVMERNVRLSEHWVRCKSNNAAELVDDELSRVSTLLEIASAKVHVVLKDLAIYHRLPDMSREPNLFLPEWPYPAITHNPPFSKMKDCLRRSYIHRRLDAAFPADSIQENDILKLLEQVDYANIEDLNHRDVLGRSVLHIACQKKYARVTRKLIELGTNIHACTEWGALPFHYAAASGSIETCRIFLAPSGIEAMNKSDNWGHIPLFYAIRNQSSDIVKLLLFEFKVDPTVGGLGDLSPLTEAVRTEHELHIKLLIDFGALRPGHYRGSILHFATHQQSIRMVRYLVEKYALSVEEMDECRSTPLSIAAEHGFVEGVQYFLRFASIEMNTRDLDGCTPIMLATRNGHLNVVKYLLEQQMVDLMLQDDKGRTVMDIARKRGQDDVAELLEEEVARRLQKVVCLDNIDGLGLSG